MKKILLLLLISLSFVFLCAGLYSADYLKVPVIISPVSLIASFAAALAGFLLDCISFKVLLRRSGHNIPLRTVVAAVGLNSFSKYIPGKMWGMVGTAMYIASDSGGIVKVAEISVLFFTAGLINMVCGLALGIIGLFIVNCTAILTWATVICFVALLIVLFTPLFHATASKIFSALFHRRVVIPQLSPVQTLYVLPWFLLSWAALGAAFYFLVCALEDGGRSAAWLFAYPLAASAGVLSVFAPGGIGVREGVLALFLSHAHLGLAAAVTVSAASRLWALAGETMCFIIGVCAAKKKGMRT